MERTLWRTCLLEFLGTFALVYFAGGAVYINQLASPQGQPAGQATLAGNQPGLVGIALAYGLIVAALLPISVAANGGYLNPAVTLTLWVYGRIDTRRMFSLAGAQFVASLIAAGLLRISFEGPVVQAVRGATPHLNSQAYPELQRVMLATGTGIELILTFFLVLAMFAPAKDGLPAGLGAGAVVTAGVLVAFPLTGAALNPARWFGPCAFEAMSESRALSPWVDTVIYVAGPILGSLLAGFVCFRVLEPKPVNPTR